MSISLHLLSRSLYVEVAEVLRKSSEDKVGLGNPL